MGFQARVPSLIAAWRPILIAYLVVTLSRTVVTYGLNAVHPKEQRLSKEWTAVLTWSGLRGSLAMVLALSLPPTMPQRDLVVTITIGVVVLSILVQGLTVRPLLRWLGISEPPAVHE
jgi:monovalent cation:H+ antiporter, CPA1 family